MSRSFDGSNDYGDGAFSSTYAIYPSTLAAWIKITVHPIALDCIQMVGVNSASANNSLILRTGASDNAWQAAVQTGTGGSGNTNVVKDVDGVWTPFIGIFISDTSREIWFSDQNDSSATSNVLTGVLQYIRCGTTLAGANDYTGKIAEMCYWDKQISAGDITNFLAGNSPLTISGANLRGYWPMSSDGGSTEANLGTDSGGDLTWNGTTFDADHPTITGGGSSIAAKVRYYNMLRTGT